VNKEKVFAWIESLEDMADQSDRYFVERTELYKENQEKDKEIQRLNNIIDLVVKDMEMTKYNPELPTYNSCVAVDKDHIQQWIDKLKELKEGK